ncbi:uncharacterized protein LOC116604449 [Nematostella vectensis]|uniref:uncharacterized protein LOC116604449 n=1 Tax=Nematostella vectensis TaxID=45351 RepID=UPI0020770AC2|nr:uncharacterized protein LOC116604449 [Nematostella vectensis]
MAKAVDEAVCDLTGTERMTNEELRELEKWCPWCLEEKKVEEPESVVSQEDQTLISIEEWMSIYDVDGKELDDFYLPGVSREEDSGVNETGICATLTIEVTTNSASSSQRDKKETTVENFDKNTCDASKTLKDEDSTKNDCNNKSTAVQASSDSIDGDSEEYENKESKQSVSKLRCAGKGSPVERAELNVTIATKVSHDHGYYKNAGSRDVTDPVTK